MNLWNIVSKEGGLDDDDVKQSVQDTASTIKIQLKIKANLETESKYILVYCC